MATVTGSASRAVSDILTAQLPQMAAWQYAMVTAVLALVFAQAVWYFLTRVVGRAVRRTDTSLDATVLENVNSPLRVTLILFGLYIATIPLDIPSRVDFYLRGGMSTVLIVLWARAVKRVGARLIKVSSESKRFDHDFGPVFRNLWTFLVVLTAVFAVLSAWQINITPLLASAGIAGVAVGFAAKDTVANFFGGIALYFDNTYKIGDYVVLGSGEEGTVVDIGIRSTTMRTRDDVLVTVPNSVLNNSRITNQSVPQPKKRISIPVSVAYGTDVDRLEEALLDCAHDCDHVVDDPAPHTFFKGFGDSALQYELRVWVAEPTRDIRAQHKLNRAIYRRLGEEDLEIQFPQRDVHMRDGDGHGAA